MSPELSVIWVVLVGFQLALQAPVNSGLARTVGKLPASLVSNLIGLSLLVVLCTLAGQFGQFGSIGEAPLSTLLGGFIGAAFVASATIIVSRIGAGAVAAATIAGQLTGSLIVDNFGWVGVDQVALTGLRILGAVLLLAGTALVVYRKRSAGDPEGPGKGSLIAVPVMISVGALVALQHPLNAELADYIGGLNASLVNFITGTALLAAIVLVAGQGGGIKRVGSVRWYYLIGGLVGVITVLTALTAVKTIGAAGLTSALVTGQLLSSVALDRIGAFGLEKRKVTATRLAGIGLLVAGTFLTVS